MSILAKTIFASFMIAGSLTIQAFAQETPAPEGAMVYAINIENGATLTSPVTVQFGLKGMGVAPAGTESENTGHHHILLNTEPFDAAEFVDGIPADDNHIHYGDGQTETTLELAAGNHTIQLILGDMNHIPHQPPVVSERIEFTVE